MTCVDGEIPSFSKATKARGKCISSKSARTARSGKSSPIWHHMLQTEFMRARYLVEIEKLRSGNPFGEEFLFGISW